MNPKGRPPKPLSERFWPKVAKAGIDECWIWKGNKVGGYGTILEHGENGPVLRAHRVAWMLTNGPIPDGLLVCHKCDVRPCCNPNHLFLGTHADNTADMMAKGRGPTGERQGRAKLTAAQARQIRWCVLSGIPKREMARRFNVSAQSVGNIMSGKTWKEAINA